MLNLPRFGRGVSASRRISYRFSSGASEKTATSGRWRQGGGSGVVDVDGLLLEVAVEPVFAVLAADAAVAQAGVMGVHGVAAGAVDVDLAEFQLANQPHQAAQVLGEDVGGQAVARFVGEPQAFVEIGHGQHGDDGTEDLLLHDGHAVVDRRQHRRLIPVAAREGTLAQTLPADENLGAGLGGRLDHAFDLGKLGGAELGSDVDRLQRVADFELGYGGGEAVEELAGDALMHIHALVADADLAAVLEARGDRGLDGGADVGVLGDDERRLAAEFEAQDLQVVGGAAEDLLAGAHAAGERDQARDRMRHEGGAEPVTGAADDVDD